MGTLNNHDDYFDKRQEKKLRDYQESSNAAGKGGIIRENKTKDNLTGGFSITGDLTEDVLTNANENKHVNLVEAGFIEETTNDPEQPSSHLSKP